MDVELLLRVIWRWRNVVIIGFLVTVVVATLAYVSVDFSSGGGLKYRQSATWSSSVTLQVTQRGFPEGRLTIPSDTQTKPTPSSDGNVFADPGRLVGLAQLYVRLVNSDPVRTIMRRSGPIYGKISTSEVLTAADDPLPLIEVTSATKSAGNALIRVNRQASAFTRFITRNQVVSGIPEADRVQLKVVAGPTNPKIVAPRSKTLPVIVFISALIALTALVLVLENLRPRARAVEAVEPVATLEDADKVASRKTAARERRPTELKNVQQRSRSRQ